MYIIGSVYMFEKYLKSYGQILMKCPENVNEGTRDR